MVDFEKFKVEMNVRCVCGCMDGKRFHKVYRFPNDYGASVVSNPKSEGYVSGGYRVLLVRFVTPLPDNDYIVDTDAPIDSVVECGDWAEVEASLAKVLSL
jgi:hypothetical protein